MALGPLQVAREGVSAGTAGVLAALAAIRRGKAVHPDGVVYEARLTVEGNPAAPRGARLLSERKEHRAIVRFSRSIGLPRPLVDLLGMSIRVLDAYGPGRHQDFMLVTSADLPIAHHAFLPARDVWTRPYSSSLPYRAGGETFLIGTLPDASSPRPDGDNEFDRLHLAAITGELRFDLAVAPVMGRFRPVGELHIGNALPQQLDALRFNVLNCGGGMEPATFLNDMRDRAYRWSQAAWRRTKPGGAESQEAADRLIAEARRDRQASNGVPPAPERDGRYMPKSIDEQLIKHLTDIHSIEVQALAQMKQAPKLAGDEALAAAFEEHLRETEEQERRVSERLKELGADPSTTKDLVARVSGLGMVLFAKANPDTTGKLVNHAYSYEHMELAAYELLALVAERAGDGETVELARDIGAQERRMAERLAENFDGSVEASLREQDPDDLEDQLVSYLADAHAIEAQALQLLESGPAIAGQSDLAKVFTDHLDETRSQQAAVKARLDAHDASPNKLKDAAMRVGALNVGGFFASQPGDTPAKLAGFAFAFEHLEIAAYEQLKRVAARAGDEETVRIAERILGEERAAAKLIEAQFEPAMDASLESLEAHA